MRVAKPSLFGWSAFLLVLVASGLLLPTYWVYLLSTVAISAIVARSVGLVTNQLGIIALCQMSFAAIGGWVVSWIALAWPVIPFPLLVLVGGVVTAPVGWLIGIATARIRGVELAVVTLGFAAALDLVLRQGSFPGVSTGTPVLPSAPFDEPHGFFLFVWAVLVLLQLGVAALGRTSHGLGWAAVRQSERAAAALGVSAGSAKASALAVGALFSGVAGGLLAGQYGLLTTAVFTPLSSLIYVVTAVLCGASLFGGAVLAGAVTVFVPELLRRVGLPLDVGNALLALGAFDALRRGTGGLAEQLAARMQERAFRGTRVACDLAPPAAGASGGEGQAEPPRFRAPEHTGPARTKARLDISGLSVEYGRNRVLDSVHLSVGRAEVHALIGPNGAGKTTLVDAVTGFLPGYNGTILLDGEPIDALTARARARGGVRRTFQQLRAIEGITVDQYLRLAAGRTGAGNIPQVRDFLGLPDGRVPIRLMDVGSRRVLEVAGTLVARPRIVLLDEPAAGLGEGERLAMADRVRRMPAQFGCAVLLIEHDMEFVRTGATRATVLDEGHVISSGPVAEVLDDPRVVAAYLGREAAA